MLDRPLQFDRPGDLIACARRESPAFALMAFCRHLTCQPGFLVRDGHVLSERDEPGPLIGPAGQRITPTGAEVLADAALAQMGLALLRVSNAGGTTSCTGRDRGRHCGA